MPIPTPEPSTSYHDDGKIISGSFIAKIGNVDYVVNSLELDSPVVAIEVNDEFGRLAAKRNIADPGRRTGTCQIQINEDNQHTDLQFKTFTVPGDYNSTGADITVVIENDPTSITQTDPRTRSLTIRQMANQPEPTPPED